MVADLMVVSLPVEDEAGIYAGWGLWEMHVGAKFYRLQWVKVQ